MVFGLWPLLLANFTSGSLCSEFRGLCLPVLGCFCSTLFSLLATVGLGRVLVVEYLLAVGRVLVVEYLLAVGCVLGLLLVGCALVVWFLL